MRIYVKRGAATPAEVINIMNPISALPPNQRASYMGTRANCIGVDIYNYNGGQMRDETTEGTLAVSILSRNSRQTSLINFSVQALEIKVDRIVHFD
jgi:hypothetical protein